MKQLIEICLFTVIVVCFVHAQVPTITSFTPTSGPIGTAVNINGTNFSTSAAINIVFFGAVRATVTAATSTSLSVIVPAGAAYQPITVTTNGLTAYSSKPFIVAFAGGGAITSNSFSTKMDFTAGSNPYGVAIGDVDGDGKPDIAVTNYGSNTVSVFRNTGISGSVSFATKVDFTVGSVPNEVVFGDIDGDGKLDMAVGNQNSNTVSVFRNTSTSGSLTASSFAAKVDFTAGSYPAVVHIYDIDGDGKSDIVTANAQSNTISVFRNTSSPGSITSSSFAAKVDFTVGSWPNYISISDIDGDRKPDIAVSNAYSNNVSVLRNTSTSGSINTGSLATKVDFLASGVTNGVALGDIDGDGKPDLVLTDNSLVVSVFRNTSLLGSITSGSFAPKVDFAAGLISGSVYLGDIDGDGKPDLLVSYSANNTLSVFKNTSTINSITTSSLASKVDFATGQGPSYAAICDVDGDGKPDLVVANTRSNTVSVLRNTIGPPTSKVPTIVSFSPTLGPIGTAVTINGTNFSTTAANNIVYFGAVKATVKSATSTSLSVTVPTGATYQPITITVNGLTAYSNGPFNVVFPSSGVIDANSFAAKVNFTAGPYVTGVAIGDLDGDGKSDLAAAVIDNHCVSVYRNTSTSGTIAASSFPDKVDFAAGLGPIHVAIGDLDGDGKPDLAATNINGGNTLTVYRNTSVTGSITTSSFAAGVNYTTGTTPNNVVIGDIDGDGKPDLVVSSCLSNAISVFKNTSSVGTITASSFAAKVDFPTANAVNCVAIGDLDGDGKPDLAAVNLNINSISVFRNTSTSGVISVNSFAPRVDYPTGKAPTYLAIGDLDGDGKPDLAVTHNGTNIISVFRNTSTTGAITTTSFAAEVDFTTDVPPAGIAIGDIDGDGKLDLVAGNFSNGQTISVFKNTSTVGAITASSFATRVAFSVGSYNVSVAIGDLDGDGKPDIVVSNAHDGNISILRNTIGGNSAPAAPQNLTATAGNGQVTLKWNKITEANFLKYRIYMDTDSVTMTLKDSTSASILDTSKVITGLTNGTKYYFRVSALDSARLESVQSHAVSATPSSQTTDLVQIAGGTFQMGSNDANDYGASPPHSVTLGAFNIDKTEITYEKWTEVRNWGLTHGYTDLVTGRNGSTGTTNHPVTEVNWYDILKWCNARSEKDGLTPVYYTSNAMATVYRTGELDLAADAVKWTANGYRLPTEAEWEFAARGGTKSQGYTYSGSNTIDSVAWYSSNSGSNTRPVSTKGANELGLNDMSGNVWEWCWDWYGPYSSTAQTDPKGPSSGSYASRVLRGGSFLDLGYYCRVAYRYFYNPNVRGNVIGFRCVQTDTTSIVQNQPTVVTTAASSVSSNSATLNGSVNPNGLSTTASFEWGTIATLSPSSTTPSQSVGSGMYAVTLAANLTGLSQGTTYYFRVVGQNSFVTQRGSIVSFTPVAAVPTIAVSASSLAFGTVSTGTSAQKTFTVSNSGTATLNVSNITSNDATFAANPASFFIASGGGAQSVTVTFVPAAARTYSATLSVTHDASGSPSLISLTGTGSGSAVISLPQSSMSFGTVNLGSSTSRTLTVTNSGNIALIVTNITISNSFFAVSPTSFSLSPGASQTLTLTFTPTGGGAAPGASLVFVSNAASSPTFTLSGTGETRLSASSTQAGRFSSGIPPSTWVLMSIPYKLDDAAAGILSSQLSGQNPWVMYTYQNGQMIDYSQKNDAFAVLRGIWFKTIVKSSSFNLSFGSGDQIGGSSYPVTVPTGWSLVGPPFHSEEASWTPVNTTPGSAGIRVYKYLHESSGWQLLNPTVERMKPYGGYAVYNGTGAPAAFTYVRSGPLSNYHEWQAGDGWYGVLAIGETKLRIGQHRMASAGEDGLDYPMPPAQPEAQETPAHFAGNLWSDIRPTGLSEVLSWKVVIDPRTANSIRVTDRMDIPEEVKIVVQGIPYLGPVDMTSKDSIALPTTMQGVYTVTVLAGSAEAIAEKIAPREPLILQNYPNPFNPTTSIRYQIASESAVSLRIFNSLGEEITTLVNGPHRPGFYEVQWDGRNTMGSSVSSGIYYCVLKAGGYVAAAKVVLLK